MAQALLYCPACGAANAPDDDACFACKKPLTLPADAHGSGFLLHQRYGMLAQVGTGGFGAVYKARDTQAGGYVAIKQINLRGLSPQQAIEATDGFNREVHMLSTLSHSHLPRIHTHFTDPDHWYVVMDFIEGETLEYYLRDITSSEENAIRALGLDEVLDIGLQVCSVLAYLHAQHPPIIFRDLKPANIMRTPQGRLFLIDFGIARYFTPGQARDTIPLGSPGYAAPEQYGRAQTTPRADVYSLGALLHHLLSLHDPAESPFNFTLLQPTAARGSAELSALVARMVEQDMDLRPATVDEVEAALLRIRGLRSAEPRIWRPAAPGKATPPALPAHGAYQPPQVRQQLALQAAAKRKTRRKFLIGGLSVASTLALGGSIGGNLYWRYWHPSGLTLEAGFPKQLPTPQNAVAMISWSTDGQQVAFGLSDGSILGYRLSQKTSFALVPAFTLHSLAVGQPITALAWSPDKRFLAAASQPGKLNVWDLTSRTSRVIAVGSATLKTLAWSPTGNFITTIDESGALYLCDALNGISSLFNPEPNLTSTAMAWSPDGKRLAVERASSASMYTSSVEIYKIEGQMILSTPTNEPMFKALAWSPDGQYIAFLGLDSTLVVGKSQDNSQVFSQQILSGCDGLAWSPDSRFLTSIDYTEHLLLLDRSNGNTLVSVSVTDLFGRGAFFPGNAFTWLPDGQHIMVASNNMQYWLWTLPRF